MTVLCESPGLEIRQCHYNIQTVSFLQKGFEAKVGEDGKVSVEAINYQDTLAITFTLVIIMFLANIVYTAKIALEMNLGFSVLINFIEVFHIFVVEVALLGILFK